MGLLGCAYQNVSCLHPLVCAVKLAMYIAPECAFLVVAAKKKFPPDRIPYPHPPNVKLGLHIFESNLNPDEQI